MALEIATDIGHAWSQSAGIGPGTAFRQIYSVPETRQEAIDGVELSARWRDVQHTQQIVEDTPEVRDEWVVHARQALATGDLTLAGAALAEKLMSEQLSRT
jgi:hypothetical protein